MYRVLGADTDFLADFVRLRLVLVTMTWITGDLEVLLHVLNDLRGVLGDNLLALGRDETNGTKLIVQLWQWLGQVFMQDHLYQ